MVSKKLLFAFCILPFLFLCPRAQGHIFTEANLNPPDQPNYVEPSVLSTSEVLWEKTYGGAGDDRAFCTVPTDDNGFLIVGSSASFSEGKTTAWVVKIDSEGNMIWNKSYQQESGSEFRDAQKTANGFLLVGNTFYSSGDEESIIVRIDDQGNVLWNKTLGGEKVDKIFSAATASDGFVFVGLTYSYGNGGADAWIFKTDMNGNILWNRTYGGPGDDAFRAVLATDNQQYVMAGYTNSIENGNYDFWLVKTDEHGTVLWNHTYGGSESDKAYALASAEDGYMIVGDTHLHEESDTDALIVKTDLNGNLLWQNTYGGSNFDEANALVPSKRGGFIIAGFTFSYGKGQRDLWLFKIDDSGETVWSRVHGREAFEEAYAVVETGDDEFVVGGWTDSIGNGSYDYYVVRVKLVVSSDFLSPRALGYYALAFVCSASLILLGFLYFRLNRQKKKLKD